MPTFGLYLVTDHPLHHHILISYPATDPDPHGYCVDCHVAVDVRYIHPGWLDTTELNIDLEAVAGVDEDPATTAYAKGMTRSINTAIENYQKSRTEQKKKKKNKEARVAMKRRPFLKQVHYVRTAIKLLGRASTKSVYGKYRVVAESNGAKKLRTYRAIHHILTYLVDEGEVEVEQEALGRGGVKNFYQMREDNGTRKDQASTGSQE
jgi:hypothetical protein